MKRRRFVITVLAFVVASSVFSAGCDEDSNGEQRQQDVARSEVLLVVQNAESPLDLLQSTEANSVAFGADDGDLILEATEVRTNRSRNIAAANGGNDLLLDADEVKVRFTDSNGDGTGTLILLDGEEAELAREDGVLLSATESITEGMSIDEKIVLTSNELTNGRWNALSAAAIDLADRTIESSEVVQVSLDQLLGDLRAELGSVQDLLFQADTDNPLPTGVNTRPTLFRSLEDDSNFATDFDFELLEGEESAVRNQFFVGAGQELIDIAAGREVQRTFLPQFLEDVDGYLINLDSLTGSVRFRLNWNEFVDLDLHVITPSGAEISHLVEFADGGVLDVDNTAGGSGAIENVIFDSAGVGEYRAFVEYRAGSAPADFELTAYEGGRIVERLRGTLQPPTSTDPDDQLPRSESLTVGVE